MPEANACPESMLDPKAYRSVIGHFATGVSVVAATTEGGVPVGMTANAVTSVSLRPLLLLVCVQRDSSSYRPIIESGAYSVNVLRREDVALARRFAHLPHPDRFDGVSHHPGATGSPILDSALAWLDCRVQEVHEAGDHSIIVGEVVGGEARSGEPLVFFRGRFGGVTP